MRKLFSNLCPIIRPGVFADFKITSPNSRVAAEMGISLGSVNGYLQMSYLNRDLVIDYGELNPVTEAEKFPGCDDIDEMIQCTQTQITNSNSDEEEWQHRRQLIKLKTERDKHLRQYWITSGKIPAAETETP